jgi:DNA-binding CsgD family transcriptional regulator
MQGSTSRRPARQAGEHESGSGLTGAVGVVEAIAAVSAVSAVAGDASPGRIELEALESELVYRGPERRNDTYRGPERRGPGVGLAKLLASVLDEVDYGLLLIAADGHVVHANHAARMELAESKSVRLQGRRLVGRSPADQRLLDDALVAARDGGRRKMLSFRNEESGAEGRSCDLSIIPLPTALSAHTSGHAVLIALPRPRIAETLSVDAYARELGLTRREQEVLAGLCEGRRVKEIAARLEIGEETVRSHVKRLKAKTGCTGIVDIVNQLSRLPPMVGALRQTTVA